MTGESLYPRVRLGLRENWRQFALLVLVNAFVGGMVGLERTVVPLVGSQEFGLVLKTAIFSFIITFGLVKALSNLFACSQAGLVNNLNDGMSWGVFPLFFQAFGLGVGKIAGSSRPSTRPCGERCRSRPAH